ncbi:MAG: hypothetical protein LUG24_05205 [Clostridiales bacterium]|nr:hypothetical protein [Clostridiales bacterium]
MIDRALMIYEISNQYNIAEGYLDFEETSDWARDSVAKITAVIYRSR